MLSSMLHPSDRVAPPVGLATFPNVSSQKARGYADFAASSGTQGFGFICLNPVVVNDQDTASFSTSTFAGAAIPNLNGAATGQNPVELLNLPFATGSLGLGAGKVQARLVSYGMEIESTTAELYEQGILQIFVDPAHADITGYGSATFSGRRESLTVPLKKGEKHTITITPVAPADTQYGTAPYPYNSTATASIGGVIISGCSPTNPVTLLCRLTANVEYVGTPVDNISTPNGIAPADALNHCVEIAQKVLSHKHAHHHPKFRPEHMLDLGRRAYKAINSSKPPKSITDAFGAAMLL